MKNVKREREQGFNCDLCRGFCCVNPPLLKGYKEIKQAHDAGVKIIAVKHDKGYLVAVTTVERNGFVSCPFYEIENGRCSIYENRFLACSSFECMGTVHALDEVEEALKTHDIGMLTEQIPNDFTPKYEKRKLIKEFNIEVVGQTKARELLSASPLSQMFKTISSIEKRIEEQKKC